MSRIPSKEELALWEVIIKDIKPIERKNSPTPAPSSKRIKVHAKKQDTSFTQVLTHRTSIAPLTRQQFRNFKIEARLDLHGYTQAEAYKTLTDFITRHYEQQQRNLLIITGKGEKGQGVLKQQLPKWLKTTDLCPKILAISSARPEDGGQGAFYVVLRRKR